MYKVDNYNRSVVIARYVDDIVNGLHFLESKELLKQNLLEQKHQLTNEELEHEIMRHDSNLLIDIYISEILQEV
jgi:hypothetical protein